MVDVADSAGKNDASNVSESFDQVLPVQSAAIFREFQNGRIIVREVYDNNRSELVANPLYNLIFSHLSHFRTLYEHLGSELVFNDSGAFFYLKENSDDESEEHDENAFRVQVVLLLIGRYFARSGRDLDYLGRPDAGLKEEDVASMDRDDEYRDILRAARFEKGLLEALEYLDKRNLAFRCGTQRYFLSTAGMHFLHELVREYEAGGGA
ncbi:hypothetical protein [uncultured Marinobacter sp.]|uniref:condensin complex protein MksE n=1 Tax=uncultured Marinobacter sp. TaxID=187379 RepID=UPI0030DC50F8|tara:strand:+ start:155 stop:781 length:627 start_codon:yes stop_codon:yes gene_type:complete